MTKNEAQACAEFLGEMYTSTKPFDGRVAHWLVKDSVYKTLDDNQLLDPLLRRVQELHQLDQMRNL